MTATLDDVMEELRQIRLQNASMIAGNSERGLVGAVGSSVITAAGKQNGLMLNALYYYDVSIVLYQATGSANYTNVYIEFVSQQNQGQPAVMQMNKAVTYVRLTGVKVTAVYTDSTISNATSVNVYFMGYSYPYRNEIEC